MSFQGPLTNQRKIQLKQDLLRARQNQSNMEAAGRAYQQRMFRKNNPLVENAVGNVLTAALRRDKLLKKVPTASNALQEQRRRAYRQEQERIDGMMTRKAEQFKKTFDRRQDQARMNKFKKRAGLVAKGTGLAVGLGTLGGLLGGLLRKNKKIKKEKQKGKGFNRIKSAWRAANFANNTLGVRGTYKLLTNKGPIGRYARAGAKYRLKKGLKSFGKKSLKYAAPAVLTGVLGGITSHLLNKKKKKKKDSQQEGSGQQDWWDWIQQRKPLRMTSFDQTGKTHVPKDQDLLKIMPPGLAGRSSLMGAAADRRIRYNRNKKKVMKKWELKRRLLD